jgi:hypothetical protein
MFFNDTSNIGIDIGLFHCIISRIWGKSAGNIIGRNSTEKIGKPNLNRQSLSASHECKIFSAGRSNVCNECWHILVNSMTISALFG